MQNGRDFSPRRGKQMMARTDGIANCCTATVGKEQLLMEMQSVYTDKDGVAYCCDSSYFKGTSPGDVGKGRRTHIIEYEEPRYRVRKLTPREYARLQGFPESFQFVVSNSQLYKQFGNAVTVNVAEAIAKQIINFLDSSTKKSWLTRTYLNGQY